MERTIQELIDDESVSMTDFVELIRSWGIGDWDSVNSMEEIKEYVVNMIRQGVSVSHILAVIEAELDEDTLYKIWLGNSMETPEPIYTKEELVEALGIDLDELVEDGE